MKLLNHITEKGTLELTHHELHLPNAFSKELYDQKCSAVFEHVYESYPDQNRSFYA
jgi:hypothetical protein